MRQGTSLARRLVTMTLGVAIGITAGLASITLAAADRVEPAHPVVFDATHLPPLLRSRTSQSSSRTTCIAPRATTPRWRLGATSVVRSSSERRTRAVRPRHELEIRTADGSRQLVARVADELAGQPDGFEYYAVIEAPALAQRLTVPAGGADAPHVSRRLKRPVDVALGRHVFGSHQRAGADCVRIVGRWRHAGRPRTGTRARHDRSVGFRRRRGRDTHRPRSGASPLSPLAQGRVHRLALRSPSMGTIADIAVGDDGTTYVLESTTEPGRNALVKRFDDTGRELEAIETAERTSSQIRMAPGGPLVLSHPSITGRP